MRFLIFISFFSIILNISAQSVNIPDVNFLNALVGEGWDKNNNGIIELEEAITIDSLNIDIRGIKNLEGIQSFINLRFLICDHNIISNIDLTKNAKLEVFQCNFNKIKNLDLTNNAKLVVLQCSQNDFTSLDISKNTRLEEILNLFNNITDFDVSNSPNLRYLDCGYCNLSSLNTINNKLLTYLDCRGNASLKTICVFDTAYAKSNPKFKKDATQSWTQNCFITGFEEQLISPAISVFPNPFTDLVSVNGGVSKVRIYDNSGRVVLVETSNQFSTTALSKGIYQIVITDFKGIDKAFRLLKE